MKVIIQKFLDLTTTELDDITIIAIGSHGDAIALIEEINDYDDVIYNYVDWDNIKKRIELAENVKNYNL